MGPTPSQKSSQHVVMTSLPKTRNIFGSDPPQSGERLNEVYGAAVAMDARACGITGDPGVDAALGE